MMEKVTKSIIKRIMDMGSELIGRDIMYNIISKPLRKISSDNDGVNISISNREFHINFRKDFSIDDEWNILASIIREISNHLSMIIGPVGNRIMEKSLLLELRDVKEEKDELKRNKSEK